MTETAKASTRLMAVRFSSTALTSSCARCAGSLEGVALVTFGTWIHTARLYDRACLSQEIIIILTGKNTHCMDDRGPKSATFRVPFVCMKGQWRKANIVNINKGTDMQKKCGRK